MLKRWVHDLSVDDLRKLTSRAAKARWAKVSLEDRRAYAMKMVQARRAKHEKETHS